MLRWKSLPWIISWRNCAPLWSVTTWPVVATIQALRPPDQADLFAELNDEHQVALLPELNPAASADILEEWVM